MRQRWTWLLAAAVLLNGCCSQPGVFQKVERSLKAVQTFYEPLLGQDLLNENVRRAVVAADTTLLLAAELQRQWCPDPGAVEQLELQVRQAQDLARQTGAIKAENLQTPTAPAAGAQVNPGQ